MVNDTVRSCKYCAKPIPPEMIFNSTIVCPSCGLTDTKQKSSAAKNATIFGGVALFVIAMVSLLKDPVLMAWNPNYAFRSMTAENTVAQLKKCLKYSDRECLVAGYKRMVELEPENPEYKANLAMQLTKTQQYDEAAPIYQELVRKSSVTHDLLSFYAHSLMQYGVAFPFLEEQEKCHIRCRLSLIF